MKRRIVTERTITQIFIWEDDDPRMSMVAEDDAIKAAEGSTERTPYLCTGITERTGYLISKAIVLSNRKVEEDKT